MIRLENTQNDLGITIKGNYDDLNELYDAFYHTSDLYFSVSQKTIEENDDISEDKKQEMLIDFNNMHDCILGLCYDIRHAYQGDRDIEYIYDNKYFSVDVLYPWMIYYLMFCMFIKDMEFDEDDFKALMYPYNMIKYQKHLSLINYFQMLIWQCLIDFLGKTKTLKLYEIAVENGTDILLYDTYIEAYCTYYCDIHKKGKVMHKNMLLTFIYECLDYSERNHDYRQAVNKIEQKTNEPFLTFRKFCNDYHHLVKEIGQVYEKDFYKMVENYGQVDWDNLKF